MLKKILFGFACIFGIGGSFAFKPSIYNGGKFLIYYAISDGSGGFTWTSYVPFNYVCISGSAYCTIATQPYFVPSDNIVPNSSNLIYHSAFNSLYIRRF